MPIFAGATHFPTSLRLGPEQDRVERRVGLVTTPAYFCAVRSFLLTAEPAAPAAQRLLHVRVGQPVVGRQRERGRGRVAVA